MWRNPLSLVALEHRPLLPRGALGMTDPILISVEPVGSDGHEYCTGLGGDPVPFAGGNQNSDAG